MLTAIIMTINNKLSLTTGSASAFLTAVLSLLQVRGKMSSFQSFSSFPVVRQSSARWWGTQVNNMGSVDRLPENNVSCRRSSTFTCNPVNIHRMKHCRAKSLNTAVGLCFTDMLWYSLYVFFVHLSFMATLLIFAGKSISLHLISACKWKHAEKEREGVNVLVYTSVHFLSSCFPCHVPLLQHGLIMVSLQLGGSKQNMLSLISEHSTALFPTWEASVFLSFLSALPLTACHWYLNNRLSCCKCHRS